MFEDLRTMVNAHQAGKHGAVRLVCHCVPLRCHCESIAERLLDLSDNKLQLDPRRTAVTGTQQAYGHRTSHSDFRLARPAAGITTTDRHPTVPFGAGIIALWRGPEPQELRVCIVEKRNGFLGFPKGRAESVDQVAQDTAFREWREETGLAVDHLTDLVDERSTVDKHGCRYYFAEWLHSERVAGLPLTWLVQDDPSDPDPIVSAHWMACRDVLQNSMLSRERQCSLRQAMQVHRSTSGDCHQSLTQPDASETKPVAAMEKGFAAGAETFDGPSDEKTAPIRRWNRIGAR